MYTPKNSKLIQVIKPFLGAVFIIAIWHFGVQLTGITPLVMPSPVDVFMAFCGNWDRIMLNLGVTMFEAVMGFILGTFCALIIAITFTISDSLKSSFYPIAIAVKATPLITIAPLIIIWFGNGLMSKIVMSALLTFFPVLVAVYDGLNRLDPNKLKLFQTLKATRSQELWLLRLPNAAPSFFSALKIVAPISVVGAVIGEYTGSSVGIGHLINIESYYLNTDIVFAAIIAVAIASMIFFAIVVAIQKRVIYW